MSGSTRAYWYLAMCVGRCEPPSESVARTRTHTHTYTHIGLFRHRDVAKSLLNVKLARVVLALSIISNVLYINNKQRGVEISVMGIHRDQRHRVSCPQSTDTVCYLVLAFPVRELLERYTSSGTTR